MRTIKLTLAYDGTDFLGWQSQPHGVTLQDMLEAVLAKVTGETIRVTASGRTDAGVHALAQVVTFDTQSRLSSDVMLRALNAHLSRDVTVLCVEDVPKGFHATRDARRKRYRYVIHDGPIADVFQRRYTWHIFGRLDAQAMHRAAQALAGQHDFVSFQSAGAERETTVRTVFDISVRRGRGGSALDSENVVSLEIEADGFLYNMVRTIVGTLVQVGRGNQPETWPGEVLKALDRRLAGQKAPAQGLFLVRVDY